MYTCTMCAITLMSECNTGVCVPVSADLSFGLNVKVTKAVALFTHNAQQHITVCSCRSYISQVAEAVPVYIDTAQNNESSILDM